MLNKKEPLYEAEVDWLIELVEDNIDEGDLENHQIVTKLKNMKMDISKDNSIANKYKIELWQFHKIIDVFKCNDFEVAKEKFKAWFKEFDSNFNKGHTKIYISGKEMSIDWTYENILNVK